MFLTARHARSAAAQIGCYVLRPTDDRSGVQSRRREDGLVTADEGAFPVTHETGLGEEDDEDAETIADESIAPVGAGEGKKGM